MSLFQVKDLKKHFPLGGPLSFKRKKVVHAVDGIDFDISAGETLALVGESGCGKTTTGRLLLRLIAPSAGAVFFQGHNITTFDKKSMRDFRHRTSMIFQDPYSSLNPRKTVRQILGLPYIIHDGTPKSEIEDRVSRLLELVKLSPPEVYVDRYPHEFSGGQKQRIGIARALALNPNFILADEPVSSLDVTTQAAILALIKDLKRKFNLTLLYITHDLNIVRSTSDRVAVMYVGQIVELGPVDELYSNPLHPYTRAILSATPVPDPSNTRARTSIFLKGEVASQIDPPSGCRFHPRCPSCKHQCSEIESRLIEVSKGHFVACHLEA